MANTPHAADLVANRYADAWLSAAREAGAIEALAADVAALAAMLRTSPEFTALTTSPLTAATVQDKAIKALCDKARFHFTTQGMLRVLVRNRRLARLPAVLQAAQARLDREQGEITGTLTSAQLVDDTRLAAFREALSVRFGKKVTLETRIDADLIGGVVIRVGSTLIDDSLKTKLDRLRRRLTGTHAA